MDDLPKRIDHTVLGPTTTPSAVDRAVETAATLGTNVCVPPCYVERAARTGLGGAVVTVVGFPHGQYARESAVAAARAAARAGADELDAVVNAGRIQAGTTGQIRDDPETAPADLGQAPGELQAVREDLAAIVEATPLPVKAIVQAPLLDREELEVACELAADAGCSHAKTATGFDGGATVEDVAIMAEYLPVKASGGIGSWADAKAMLDAGADRIGASSGDAIVAEWRDATDHSG